MSLLKEVEKSLTMWKDTAPSSYVSHRLAT